MVLLCWRADGRPMRLHQYLAMTEEASRSSAALGHLMTEEDFLQAHSGMSLGPGRTEAASLAAE